MAWMSTRTSGPRGPSSDIGLKRLHGLKMAVEVPLQKEDPRQNQKQHQKAGEQFFKLYGIRHARQPLLSANWAAIHTVLLRIWNQDIR